MKRQHRLKVPAVRQALRITEGVLTDAAARLGVTRFALRRWLRHHPNVETLYKRERERRAAARARERLKRARELLADHESKTGRVAELRRKLGQNLAQLDYGAVKAAEAAIVAARVRDNRQIREARRLVAEADRRIVPLQKTPAA